MALALPSQASASRVWSWSRARSVARPPRDLTICSLVPGVQEKLGVMNKGVVYALWSYEAQNSDELSFHEGDAITILRRKDENETDWWWARLGDREGYVPKNLLGVSPGACSPGVRLIATLYLLRSCTRNLLSHDTGHSWGPRAGDCLSPHLSAPAVGMLAELARAPPG